MRPTTTAINRSTASGTHQTVLVASLGDEAPRFHLRFTIGAKRGSQRTGLSSFHAPSPVRLAVRRSDDVILNDVEAYFMQSIPESFRSIPGG